jgi:hypothetical protein
VQPDDARQWVEAAHLLQQPGKMPHLRSIKQSRLQPGETSSSVNPLSFENPDIFDAPLNQTVFSGVSLGISWL